MTDTFIINGRFNGPPGSGNGGYSCGLLSHFIDGPAKIRLRVPPPLDTAMQVRRTQAGVELLHDGVLIATAGPATVDIEVPSPPDFAAAQAASRHFRGYDAHFFPRCFVCGPDRDHGDGLRIFAGLVEDGSGPQGMVAADWIPHPSLATPSGVVADEYMWAVLDCPGAYSFTEPANGVILLGEFTVDIRQPVSAGEKCVVTGWEISHQGRKHFTGTALHGEAGSLSAVAYATWFEVPASGR